MGMTSAPSFIRDAQPFLSWKDNGKTIQPRLERIITWNTTNGLGSTWVVCEPPKSKSRPMRPSHSKKQKPCCNRIIWFSDRNSGRALTITGVELEDKVRATTEYGHTEVSVNLGRCQANPAASIEANSIKGYYKNTVGIDKVNWLTAMAGHTWGVEL